MVGAGSTTLHIAVASALLEAGGYSAGEANGVAFVVATLASYWLNTIWTFGAPLGFGSLIAGRDTLVVLTSSGSIVAADMSPLAYTERGRGSLPRGQYWTPPALAQGRLFIRDLKGDLFAIDVK